jgi:hypothetical protein
MVMRIFCHFLVAFLFVSTTHLFGQSVPSYVPTDGLVGWWGFNGNAQDGSGNGNHGMVNGATLTTDRFGNQNGAYDFDGVNDFIQSTFLGVLNGTQRASFSFWFFSSGTNGSGIPIGHWVHNASPYGSIGIQIFCEYQTNRLGVCLLGGQCSSSNVINNLNGVWRHGLIRFDGSKPLVERISLFVDGVFVQNITVPNAPTSLGNLATRTYFGAAPGPLNGQLAAYNFFNGKLDDIGIWNRALTQQEITNLSNIKLVSNTPTNNSYLGDTSDITSTQIPNNSITTSAKSNVTQYDTNLQTLITKNGGIIVSRNENGGLLAAPNDIGPYSYSQAAYQCSCYQLNGIGGWRIPSKSELQLLYRNRSAIGGFDNSYVYWSSTRDYNASTAWFIDFYDGEQGFGRFDYGSTPVRCVRNFINDEKEVALDSQDVAYFKGLYFENYPNNYSSYEGLYVYCKYGAPMQTELPDGTIDYTYALINRNGVIFIADGPDFIRAFSETREVTGEFTINGYYNRTKTTLRQKANSKDQIRNYRLSTLLVNGAQKFMFGRNDHLMLWSYDTKSKSFMQVASGANNAQLNQSLQNPVLPVYSFQFVSGLD